MGSRFQLDPIKFSVEVEEVTGPNPSVLSPVETRDEPASHRRSLEEK
jgi:hypothetical protein